MKQMQLTIYITFFFSWLLVENFNNSVNTKRKGEEIPNTNGYSQMKIKTEQLNVKDEM